MSPKDQGTDSWTDRQTDTHETHSNPCHFQSRRKYCNDVRIYRFIATATYTRMRRRINAQPAGFFRASVCLSVFEASTTRLIAHACVHLKRMHCNNDDDRDDDDNTTSSLINHNIVGRILESAKTEVHEIRVDTYKLFDVWQFRLFVRASVHQDSQVMFGCVFFGVTLPPSDFCQRRQFGSIGHFGRHFEYMMEPKES